MSVPLTLEPAVLPPASMKCRYRLMRHARRMRQRLARLLRDWPPWQAWRLRRPVEASVVLGGAWGLIMFAIGPLLGASYDRTTFVLALAFGLLGFGPLSVWLARRRAGR